jgi:hypothetical protein
VTSQAGPVRQPADDLVAFDVSKRSPQQIALLFARWKEQRKRLQQRQEPERTGRPSHLRPVPAIVRGSAQDSQPASEDPPSDGSPGQAGPVRYSASFAALLAAGREPRTVQRVWNPQEGLPKLGRLYPAGRRSKVKWALAGAASVIAVTAVAGVALWQQSSWRPSLTQASSDSKPAVDTAVDAPVVASPSEAEPNAAPLYLLDIATAEPFFAIATASPAAEEWPLKQTIDLALMKASPVDATVQFALMPRLKPPVPTVQATAVQATAARTASKSVAAPKSVTVAPTELGPKLDGVAPVSASVAIAPATGTETEEAEAKAKERRPAALLGRGNNKDNFGTNDRTAAASGSAGSSGGSDPASGGTGNSGAGDPASGSDPGGSDPGGSDPGGSDPGGSDPGGSDPGGSDSGEGGSGDSGGALGDAVGGAIGGAKDAIGGALGGLGGALGGLGGGVGKGKGSGGDKDKDKDKDKGKN